MIKIKNLKKSYGKLEVLKGIDLEIKKGQVVVIIGPFNNRTVWFKKINFFKMY